MGGREGYEYRYGFFLVDKNEIRSLHTTDDSHLPVRYRGGKAFIYEVKTDFILSKRRGGADEREEESIIIDSESYDARAWSTESAGHLSFRACLRMYEYWMKWSEILTLWEQAFAFAQQQMASDPSLNPIPVVVSLEVRTVQRDGESCEAAMDRAICKGRMVPLYLWSKPTMIKNKWLPTRIKVMDRIRVGDKISCDEAVGLMDVCSICLKKPFYGAQISKLEGCKHAFHSHCIVRWLEGNNLCPLCRHPAY